MSLPDYYTSYWNSWVPVAPPVDPRGPHHAQPDPEFAALCADAERAGVWVELDVSARPFGEEGREYRNVVALHVRHSDRDRPRVTVRVQSGDTLRSMAARARRSLEAQV